MHQETFNLVFDTFSAAETSSSFLVKENGLEWPKLDKG